MVIITNNSRTNTQAYETTRMFCEKSTLDLAQLRILEQAYEQRCDEFRMKTNHKFDVPRASYVDSLNAVRDVINARTLGQKADQLTLSSLSSPSNVHFFADYAKRITQKAVAAALVGAVSLSTLLYTPVVRADDVDDRRARMREGISRAVQYSDKREESTLSNLSTPTSATDSSDAVSYDPTERNERGSRRTPSNSNVNSSNVSGCGASALPSKATAQLPRAYDSDPATNPDAPLEGVMIPIPNASKPSATQRIKQEIELNIEPYQQKTPVTLRSPTAHTTIGGCGSYGELEIVANDSQNKLSSTRSTSSRPTYSPPVIILRGQESSRDDVRSQNNSALGISSECRIMQLAGPNDRMILNTVFYQQTTALPPAPVKTFTRNRGGDERTLPYKENNPQTSEPMKPLLPSIGIKRTPVVLDADKNDTKWFANGVEGKHHPRYDSREEIRAAHQVQPNNNSMKPLLPRFGIKRNPLVRDFQGNDPAWITNGVEGKHHPRYDSREEIRARMQQGTPCARTAGNHSLAELFYVNQRKLGADTTQRDADFAKITSSPQNKSIDECFADTSNTVESHFMKYSLALTRGDLKTVKKEIDGIYQVAGSSLTENAGKLVFDQNHKLKNELRKVVKKANADARWDEYDLADRVIRNHREKIVKQIIEKSNLSSIERMNAGLYATRQLAEAATTEERKFIGWRILNDIIQAPANLVVRDVSHLAHKNRLQLNTAVFDQAVNEHLLNLGLGYEGPRNDYTKIGENILHAGIDAVTTVGLAAGVWAGASAISAGSIKGPSALIGGNGNGGIFGGEVQHGGIVGHRSRNVRFNPVGEGKSLIKRNNGYQGFKKTGAFSSQRRTR